MIGYVAGRLLQLVPLLWVVVTLVFVPMRLIPGDPATVLLGVEATEDLPNTRLKSAGSGSNTRPLPPRK